MRFANPFRWRFANLLEHQNAPSLTAGLEDITETCFSSEADGCRLDKEKGIFYNAKIRGRVSENGREYGPQCDEDGIRLYEGAEINIDHPPNGKESMSRTFTEGWAVARGIRKDPGGGNRGDVHFLKTHPITEQVIERYEKGFPLGLSHNAVGKVGKRNGKAFVEGLQSVRSIDLVRRPATTKNLNESLDGETTVGDWALLFETKDAELAKLVEGLIADPKASPAPMNYSPTDGETDQVKSAIVAAITAVADVNKLKSVLKSLLSEDSEMDPNDKSKAPVKDKQTTEALEALTEHTKADEKLAAHVKTLTEKLTEALAAKPATVSDTKAGTLKELTERLDATEAELAAARHEKAVRKFMEAKHCTPQSLGAARVKLLESCQDEAAMTALHATWPQSVNNVRPPLAQLQNVTESVAPAAPKSFQATRSLIRSR